MEFLSIRRKISFILLLAMIFSVAILPGCNVAAPVEDTSPSSEDSDPPAVAEPVEDPQNLPPEEEKEFRGIWVSTILNLDYPSAPGLSTEELKAEAAEILDNCAEMGFNAVILQVRPAGDALYPSKLFPWSENLTGEQGKAPEDGFDPLQYWVEEAHARGLELHAWINPYRVARQNHDLTTLDPSNYARKNPGWVIKHTDGHMYYNPGIPAVRALVVDGVAEIVENYDVDGIHFDDYFYPDNKVDDEDTYKKYGSGFHNIHDWRRDNINKLVEETYQTIKAINPEVRFGISPFGIWANETSHPLGSATNGNQSYSYQYADSREWILNGWVDYIAPQLYWNIGYTIADYEVLVNWWADLVRDTGVDLYIGHSAYRSGNSDPNSPWYGTAELRRQLNMNQTIPEVKGSIQFRYAFFLTYPPLGRFISTYYSEFEVPEDYPHMPTAKSAEGISLGRPATDITTPYDKMYVIGQGNPNEPLLLNGTVVENMTDEGYFGVTVPLNVGENILTFTQGEFKLVRKIVRSNATTSAAPLKKATAEIIEGSTYPDVYNVYITPGEKITFRCTAPIGADVKVTLAGKTYPLYPSTTKSPGNDAVYYTGYSYTYTMPATTETGKVLVIGTPVYTMTYKGKTTKRTATADLRCITPRAPYYAKVITDNAFLYANSNTGGGPIGELKAGMIDYITAVTSSGTWVRLGIGGWVKRVDIERIDGSEAFSANLSQPVYTTGEKWDQLQFSVSSLPMAKISFTDSVFTLTISSGGAAPGLKIPNGALIAAYSSTTENGNTIYRLIPDRDVQIDGYYLDAVTNEDGTATLTLFMKRRLKASSSVTKPLEGFVIMLDAGHGNSDTGALGPLGTLMSEKHITLHTANKVKYELEELGAEVLMTRTGDEAITLEERLDKSRAAKPDLFLSIHNNAVDVTVDATSIVGISTWYMRGVSYDFAQEMVTFLAGDLGRQNRKANNASLYVCRGTWTPSVILETGFICSPKEFSWLSDDRSQTELARAIARGIVQYFS